MAERVYLNFNYPNGIQGTATSLTGIRTKDKVIQYVSGFYIIQGAEPISFVYKGTLLARDIENINNWHTLTFSSTPERTVVNTVLYGPDALENDNIRIVGSYTITQANGEFGCIYEGPLDGSGQWTILIPTSSEKVLNTIAYSTMGDLVVGNYQTDSVLGKAFIYNVKTRQYQEISKPKALSLTAYGIWHNGKDKYTICGGFNQPSIILPLDLCYLVDYNIKTGELYNWGEYAYNNDKQGSISHFDGISKLSSKSYSLVGVAILRDITPQAFFVPIHRNCAGKFEQQTNWENINFPTAETTTGNSVTGTTMIGVATFTNAVNGYAAVLI